MLFGSHVSISGGVVNAPANAGRLGCEVFQMFTRSPQGGKAKPLTKKVLNVFWQGCREHKQKEWYVHTPYYLNLASAKKQIRRASIKVIRLDLERASLLKAKYLMTHLGSSRDLGQKAAIKMTVDGLVQILKGYKRKTPFLIEISAGSGNIIGDSFEEIAEIIKRTERRVKYKIGACFDTCHAFASGYDLRSKKAVNETFKKFDKVIGLSRLKLIHVNDALKDLGSHVDRHAHIGKGKIGLAGFRAMIKMPKLKNVNMVLETKPGEGKVDARVEDLRVLKKMRGR